MTDLSKSTPAASGNSDGRRPTASQARIALGGCIMARLPGTAANKG